MNSGKRRKKVNMESASFSRKEVVQGEIEIMKSAFADEFEEIEEKGEDDDPHSSIFRLKLGPHHTQGGTLYSHMSVIMSISTSPKYPDQPAVVKIESSSGITDKESQDLEAELRNMCLKFSEAGMVIMLDLSHHVQNFLSEHARPYTESIYAEMVAGWKAKEEAKQLEEAERLKLEEKQEEEKMILFKEEVERVEEALKEEARERRKRMKHCLFNNNLDDFGEKSKSPMGRRNSRSTSEGSAECSFNEIYGGTSVSFTLCGKQEMKVKLLESLGERPQEGCSVNLGMDKDTQGRVVSYTWSVFTKKIGKNQPKIGQNFLMEELVSKISSIEKEMTSLLRLSHENLVPYKAMKWIHQQTDNLTIHIIQDYVQGISLKYYFDFKISVSESFLHHISSGVLKALDYLHSNNVVHKNIRDSCVFLDQRHRIVKLADFGVERKCVEAVMEFHEYDAPFLYPMSPGRGGKKCDVFRFGILMLSLYLGERVSQVAPSLPQGMNKELKNFLSHCLELSEQERWTSHQLVLHGFICGSGEETGDSFGQGVQPNLIGDTSPKQTNGGRDAALLVPLELPPNLKGYSRFNIEYDFLELLGKGGFGHVYKVRNKVDDRVYAIKRIPLHHQTETTRRKMIREVKLLSSLNHENVVRYYTSWIEHFTQDQLEDKDLMKDFKDSTGDKTASSYEDQEHDAGFIESESEEDEQDWLLLSLRLCSDKDNSEDVLFINSSESKSVDSQSQEEMKSSSKPSTITHSRRLQYLFIQMQYCEKNTLRQAIDNHLYAEEDRVWQLFREMANGLDYIHSQGLIHRDLKPGNVFLDSSDHIKIGDFGLATVAFKGTSTAHSSDPVSTDTKDSGALTGHVGTTLYIAPELTKVSGKVSYSNKVDIYSLGIIFFEMVYPLSTGMERVKLLSALRLPEPQFPDDFESQGSSKKQKLARWLLNQDPLDRPSTGELLKSSLLPPPTAEEQKFMDTLESKIQNTRSKDYQDILNLLFKRCARPELEATFEIYLQKFGFKQFVMHDLVKEQITLIFRSHGGVWLPTSFYLPRGSFYQEKENLVCLMSRGGELIAAQFELRYPFARFIARTDIKHIRRYSIDRVQRAHKTSGIHPTEIYECAFDIIGAKHEYAESCARVIFIAQEVLQKISGLQSSQVIIKLSHSELLKVILFHCGVEEIHHPKVVSFLYDFLSKDFRGRPLQMEYFGKYLSELGINRNALENLKGFLVMEGPVKDICATLRQRMASSSKKRQLHACLQSAIAEVKEIVELAYMIGVRFEMLMRPIMVVDQNLYRGVCFQLVLQMPSKKSTLNVLAQGGSYEHLIMNHRNQTLPATKRPTEISMSAVGVSLPLELIVKTLDSNKTMGSFGNEAKFKFYQAQNGSDSLLTEVFICAIEQRQLEKRVTLTNELKAENISTDHGFVMNKTEADCLCEEFWFIPHFVFLYPSEKVICRSNDGLWHDHTSRASDRKINRDDLFDYLSKLVKANKGFDNQPTSVARERRESFKVGFSGKPEEITPHIEYVTRKQTRIKDVAKIESQITDELTACICSRWSTISPGDSVEVLALDLEKKALLALGQLDVDSTVRSFNDSIPDIKSRFPEMKDYIDKICKHLLKKIFYRKKTDRQVVIICYSIPSECFKRIL